VFNFSLAACDLMFCFGEKKEEQALVKSKWGHDEIKLFFFGIAFDKVLLLKLPPCLWALV
jgi:hypothetical protein